VIGEAKKLWIGLAMIVVGVVGLILLENVKTDNCWSKYTTENEAIMNCEVRE